MGESQDATGSSANDPTGRPNGEHANHASSSDPKNAADAWKPGEYRLRQKEIRVQQVSTRWQAAGTAAALFAALAAVVAALQAVEGIRVAQESVRRQADEQRLSTSISSIGAENAGERVAGFTLLRRHVTRKVHDASQDVAVQSDVEDAYDLYRISLDVFENYVRQSSPPRESSTTRESSSTEGISEATLGEGPPVIRADQIYAAQELRALLRERQAAEQLYEKLEAQGFEVSRPSVDLSNVQLYGISWPGVDVSWLGAKFFAGVDLRGANLTSSKWHDGVSDGEDEPGATLAGAHLQCANLSGAMLQRVDLNHADLRGADLRDADLRSANLRNANLAEANISGTRFGGAKLRMASFEGAVGMATARGLGGRESLQQPRRIGSEDDYLSTRACLSRTSHGTEFD